RCFMAFCSEKKSRRSRSHWGARFTSTASGAGCSYPPRSHRLAAFGRAIGGVLGLGETLALARVLALAGIVRALAGALTLAGVGAGAMHRRSLCDTDEGGRRKNRGGGDE